jgi:hypothetical protein
MIPGLYHLQMGYERAVDGAPIGQFHLPADYDTLYVTLPTRFPSPSPDEMLYQVIGDELSITDYQLTPGPSWSEGSVWLTIYWRALRDVRRDYVLLIRLLTVDGVEAAYWLGRPARSALSTDQWRAGQRVQDPWLLSLPPDPRGDTYRLELAVFDAQSEAEVARFELGELSIP